LCPAIFDRDVAAFDIAEIAQTLAERAQAAREKFWRLRAQEPDGRQLRRLRTRRERPCDRRAAEEGDEFASLHIRSQAQETALYRLRRVL
jgi:hypothetical protein